VGGFRAREEPRAASKQINLGADVLQWRAAITELLFKSELNMARILENDIFGSESERSDLMAANKSQLYTSSCATTTLFQ